MKRDGKAAFERSRRRMNQFQPTLAVDPARPETETAIPIYPILHRIREILSDFQFNSQLPGHYDELLTLIRRAKSAIGGFDPATLRCFSYLLLQIVFLFLKARGETLRALLAEIDKNLESLLLITPETILLCALVEPIMADIFATENLKLLICHFEWSRAKLEPIRDHVTNDVFEFLVKISEE